MSAAVSAERRARLLALLRDKYKGETLEAFIRRVSPRHPPPRHAAPIMRLWERTRTERVFAVVEAPPRHVKTTIALHGLAWRMARDPVLVHGFATFGDDYAASRSRVARQLARSGGVELSREMANYHEWLNIYGGGGLFAGIRGEWTGRGITGVGYIDDPYKDRREAESPKTRAFVQDWFGDVFWTRLEPGSSVIVCHTRWHEKDLIGWLLAGGFPGYQFERIRLPAICDEEDDILGRNLGEALWPERYPVEELRKIEKSIGPYSWASLFQQRPRPKGVDVFKEPTRYLLKDFNWSNKRILLCCDPAATEDTRNDFSAAFVLAAEGFGDDMKAWVVFGWRDHVEIPELVDKLVELQNRYWRAPVVVEAVNGFKAVPQMLRKINSQLRVKEAKVNWGDKFTRAQPLAAAWNAGRVFVPLDAELVTRRGVKPTTWADELIGEASVFTGIGDDEDDQIDALAHGFNEMRGGKIIRRGAERSRLPFG